MGSFAALPYPHINPIFLELGPLQFRWYGLMYLIGLTAAYFLIRRKVAEQHILLLVLVAQVSSL